jgi:hypothetical protein
MRSREMPTSTAKIPRGSITVLAACMAALLSPSIELAAQTTPLQVQVDPSQFGLDIPRGTLVHGNGRRVVTHDDQAEKVVGKIHAEIGDRRVVFLPDGRLVVRTAAEAPDSERPFEAMTKEALIARLTAEQLKGFKVKQTRNFIYVYNSGELFATATSRILETMYPGLVAYAETAGIPTRPPEVPLVVIMFRTEQEYQNYRRMPPGIVAYYNILDNRVAMYEETQIGKIKPELGIQQSISVIAHEGGHQILANIGVQQRLSRWPQWISEGVAEYFAPTTTDRSFRWKGVGQVNDMRMFELENFIKARSSETVDGKMVQDTVTAAGLTSTGYASAWALTHYLAKTNREAFNGYLRELSKLKPFEGETNVTPPGIIAENRALFATHFGDDLGNIEKRLVLHLKKLPYNDPFAEYPHFVSTVISTLNNKQVRDANVFHTPELAVRWSQEAMAKMPADQKATARAAIRPFANRPLAEQYARAFLSGR